MLQSQTLRPPTLWTMALLGACTASEPDRQINDSGAVVPDSGTVDLGLWPDATILADAMVGGFADAGDAGEWPDAMEPDSGVDQLCPPQAPFGIAQGDRLPPTVLVDCDGNERTLQDLCSKKASWMFILAGW